MNRPTVPSLPRDLACFSASIGFKRKKTARLRGVAIDWLESRQLLSAAVWASGANLPAARGDSGAVLTSTGIYVFGGASGGTATRSVVELNPDSNFTATAKTNVSSGLTGLGVGQSGFYAVLYGGTAATTPTSSAQEYTVISNDGEGPVTVPSMSVPRAYFANTTDSTTGEIFAIGGLSKANQVLASAEEYNPGTNTWSAIAPLPTALVGASAASDGAGHIFVFGGQTSAGVKVSTVYRYTIASNSWDQRTSMPVAVSDATAVYGFYGSIYVAGGKSAAGAVNNFELYNPVLDTWTSQGTLPAPRYGAAGVVDYNSDLDLIGGFGSNGAAVNTVLYTAVAATTAALPQPPVLGLGAYSGTTSIYSTYDGAPQPATATAVDPTYRNPINGTFSFTYNGSSTVPTNAGTYNVVAYFTSQDPNYVDGVIAGAYYISPAYPTITVTGGGTFTYDGHSHGITASEVGVDGVTPAAGSFTYSYNGSSTAPTLWGSYSAVATFSSADPNYSDATSAPATISIPDPRVVTGVAVTGTSTSSVNVSWTPVALPDGSTPQYDVLEQTYTLVYHSGGGGKGGGGGGYSPVYSFSLYAANVSGTSISVPSPTEAVINASRYNIHPTFEIESVDTASSPVYVSNLSDSATGDPLYAPIIPYVNSNDATVEVGSTASITPPFSANETPVYTLSGNPSTMSVNSSGAVIYSPVLGESGTVTATIIATNSLGSASQLVTFSILQRPTVVVTGGTFSYDGNVHAATAVAYDINGNVLPGTFTFQYQPVGINVWSTASYVSPGMYNVLATFTPSVSGYGGATGTGTQIITTSLLQVLSFPGPTGYIGLDSTDTNLAVSGTVNGGSGFGNIYPLSSFDAIQATGSYLGTNLEIDFTNGNPIPINGLTYTGGEVAGANSITIVDDSGNPDTIVSNNGQLTVNGRVINYSVVGSVSVQSTGAVALDVASGNFEIPPNSGSTIDVANFSSITIGAGATLTLMSSYGQAPRTVVDTAGLSIAGSPGSWTGTLDLGGNDLIVKNTAATAPVSLSTLNNQLASGYNGGAWNGTGIQSSTAATDSNYLTALGSMQNGLASTFDGQTVDSNSILIKYTYYGDTNLDGVVDGSDYSRIDNGFLNSATGWNNGDVNFDGIVDGSDYTLMDNTFNTQGASLAAQIATPVGRVGSATTGEAKVGTAPSQLFQSQTPISVTGFSTGDILEGKKDLLDNLEMR